MYVTQSKKKSGTWERFKGGSLGWGWEEEREGQRVLILFQLKIRFLKDGKITLNVSISI